jgi:hypothetical protein
MQWKKSSAYRWRCVDVGSAAVDSSSPGPQHGEVPAAAAFMKGAFVNKKYGNSTTPA